ncbi:putative ribonuclease H-like domain-containing protein [Tanacetum coccineum]
MGDENHIRTLEDCSKPSHEGYRNTIELPVENNVVPLRSDTIRLVQNECSFHGLRSEDLNQHLKNFLKLVDSLDFDSENRERTHLQDLTTRFLAQFFPPGRTAKLRNDILMFQQHHEESLSEAWTRFKDLLQKVLHHGIDLWLQIQIFYYRIDDSLKRTIDFAAGGQLRRMSAKRAWIAIEELAQYEDEGWNEPVNPEDGDLNYENPNIEQLLGIIEHKVDALMNNALSAMGKSQGMFEMTRNGMYRQLPEPSRQAEFEHIVTNFIFDQVERIRQLEDYMQVIAEEFMEFSSENGIGVNAGDSKLMLLGINLLLLGKVNAARHKLTAAGEMKGAHTIKYALTVNPTIYTSCIEQFWAIVKAKTINGEVQLQARVDGKKIIVTEASIRSGLQLNVEEGMDCLPNATIFEELARMGAKTIAWNEFSSTMASAIICLATNQKFNFSKYIFESMVKNLDNASKFLMYPRFVQVFLDKQLEGMSSHKKIYVTPSHTKKIFGNMKRVGKGSAIPTDPHHTPTIIQPSTSQPKKKQRSRKPKRKDTEVPQSSGPTTNFADEAVYEERDNSLERAATTATGLDAEQDRGGGPKHQETIGDTIAQTRSENVSKFSNDLLLARGNTLRSDKDRLKLQELMELCTNLQNRVIDLEKTKTAQAQEITSLKLRVKKLEKKGGSRTHKIKRLYKVGRSTRIVSSDEASLGDQGRYSDDIIFDVSDLAGEEVFVVEQGVSNKDVNLSVDEVTLAQALAALKTTSTRPKAKGLVIHEEEQATTLTISSQQPSQAKIQDKTEFDEQESIEREKSEANIPLKEIWDDIQAKIEADYLLAERLQAREQEDLTIEERAILFQQLLEKRRKHFAAKRAEEKRNRPPTKSSTKEYHVYLFEKHGKMEDQRFEEQEVQKKLNHMLKSFDREDLKTLYKLVKAKYGSTRPVEDLDLVLYGDLKTMFDTYVEDQVWKNQSDYRVLEWKLYDSCRVHSLRNQNVHIHMLVEKRYPLTPATITDILNKKLKVDHWNEMCYQLYKLITKQLKNQ